MWQSAQCLQGGGEDKEVASASATGGSSKSVVSAALMPEDETLDVDGETAPLIDEEA